ncbi:MULTISPECIES: phosphonate ABC transporter, permease protein PhnE [Devosia]|uniref:phosphonate ABC transporter, permease protein PhnE n=1 Tax=Devosia TaxID=46913 RepID=UPI000CE9ABA7|nr:MULTISPECIES: phosphonate ABC transporter, permease protein PhnE [Devosia]AVF04404.1 phosphonate ABC transporter, permease protein PhnE [Devosia sp. I507]
MSDVAISGPTAPQPPDLRASYLRDLQRRRLYSGLLLALFALLFVSGFMLADDRNAGGFWDGLPKIFDFPSELVAEAVEKSANLPAHFVRYFPSLLETINIAAASTLVGAILASVISMLATRGLARWPALIPVFRRVMDIMRAVPEVVIALVLIFVLGGGPVAAMIAIAFHTTGALGKLFSEVNENADLRPVEGLASVGSTWTQRMWFAVLPQVAPNYLSYGLMRFEINIRASAILGFVGSGGIGYDLRNAMSWGKGRYDEVAAIFILLLTTIVIVDQLSSHYRNRLVRGV